MREMNHMAQVSDFENREDFDELEEEKNAFENFFARAWKNTKKQIRANLLKGNKK